MSSSVKACPASMRWSRRPAARHGIDAICIEVHDGLVSWTVLFHAAFEAEFADMPDALQDELLAHAMLLRAFGPQLGRPTVDTLKGSRHLNMKELRVDWAGQRWRVAFAFDPKRQAILLVSGNKGGANQRRFYGKLIRLADARFDEHLIGLSPERTVARSERKDGKKS